MKKIGVLALALSAFLSMSVSAFQIEQEELEIRDKSVLENIPIEKREKAKEYLKKWNELLNGYDIEFELNGTVMVIKCPHDGGITEYAVRERTPVLIKSTDTCKHEVAFEIEERGIKFYRDMVPYMLAEDYCGWRYHWKVAFGKTWEKHSVLKQVQQKKSKLR